MITFLARLVGWVVPPQKQHWAEGMQSEIANIGNKRNAVWFALGCLIAAIQFRFAVEDESATGIEEYRVGRNAAIATKLFAGLGASAIGIAYLSAAHAPQIMLLVNGAATVIGLMLLAALHWTTRFTARLATILAFSAAVILMATALLGNPVGGASRWIKAGPMFVQTSLLFLPLAVVLFARVSNAWTTLSILLIAIAVAVQPDRAMSGALFSALAALTLVKRTPAIFCALAASGASFMATLLQADRLLAVPYVDHILWSSFDIHPLMGAALWLGCALLILPSFLLRSSPLLPEGIAFAACWAAIIGAAAMGAYPTPLVGYGASAIIGYFICLTALRNRAYARDLGEVPQIQDLHAIKHDPFELRLAPLI